MTTVYFIRHAESDNTYRDGRTRPLTEKGLFDRRLVTEFLQDKDIGVVISSPFKRAVDTVSPFAEKHDLRIVTIEDLREQHEDAIQDDAAYFAFNRKQWDDFSCKLPGGESIAELQSRNIAALEMVIEEYRDMNIVIGTHGMALSAIINYYDHSYGFDDFCAMIDIKPWVVKFDFDGGSFCGLEKIDLFGLFDN